ncbi:acyltransferase family protein [Ornithobacterium rhinotracheale]
MKYRIDIDGLRALAVISVIAFHFGFLPNGYLGVDIFFVISGFLITSIAYNEVQNDKFSVAKFYERRIRRIIPLLLVVTTISLFLGMLLMLPGDLENLAQAAVASNLSANNILMMITSSDYWNVTNEYKPLMHTWSLGI